MQLETNPERWILLDEVDSTNSYLQSRASAHPVAGEPEVLPSGTVCLARRQTAGRGRGGKLWIAPPDSAFIFSALIDTDFEKFPPARMVFLPLLCGVATLAAAREAWLTYHPATAEPELLIKWPNDVYLRRGGSGDPGGEVGKLAGVLVETSIKGNRLQAVLGVGLNWNAAPSLADGVDISGFPIQPLALLPGRSELSPVSDFTPLWIKHFNRRIVQLSLQEPPPFLSEIRANFYLDGRVLEIGEKKYLVKGLLDDGGLLLQDLDSHTSEVLYDAPEHMKVY